MIEAQLRDFAPVIAQKLCEELRYEPGAFDSVYRAMEYSLMAGGKRLRPFLVGAFYHAAGGKGDSVRRGDGTACGRRAFNPCLFGRGQNHRH